MIYLINGGTETAVTELITANHSVDLDGADTLSVTLGVPYTALVNDDTQLRFDGQLYNVTAYTMDTDGQSPICTIEAEHISYELNDPEYNLMAFAMHGTPAEILAAALEGTPYSVGTVEPTGVRTILTEEEATRRAIIFTISVLCDAEITYSGDGHTVNLLNHRGSSTPIDVFETDAVTHVSYSRSKLDGTTNYTLGFGQRASLVCGDELHIEYSPLGMNVDTRIIAMSYNPYDPYEVSIDVGDSVPDIVDSFVEEDETVSNILQTFSIKDGKFISKTQVEEFISSIEQSAEQISWIVKSGTGVSQFVLTDEMLALVSQNITINGFVTFNDLAETGMTSINGSFIKTNHLLGQSEATGLELDAPTAGGEITATVSQEMQGSRNYVKITLSAPSTQKREFELIGTTSTGAKVQFTLPIEAGSTEISISDWEVYKLVTFALSGRTTLVFSDEATYGVSCTGDFIPSENASSASVGYSLGTPTKKWKSGYLYSGVITGSARKYKKSIRDLNSKHLKLFDALRPRSFLFRNGESGRRHYGFIVDEFSEAIAAAGLTPETCAAYVLDDPEDATGGGGLRYEELIPVLVAKIQAQDKKIKELEAKV